ncbi:Sulfate adenylyltransferase subunit 1 [Minicystis rosea]|nr:Sulfate adenylyltransferase subunit 1 [Minicystis rosea]
MRDRELIETDVEAFLVREQHKEILRFLTAGSVDDGKSTLIGRLLHDSNMVYDDQLAALRKDSAKKSSAGGEIDYSLLVDGLLSEREQGITIDVAYRYFATDRRKFIIADTPGHEQYTRNMATGASTADLAIILIDARYGVLPQTRRHSFIASLLGIRHIVAAVNKMDLVGYDEGVFTRIRSDYAAFTEKLGFTDIHYLPLSALKGDNVVERSEHMPFYAGPPLLEHLETVPVAKDKNVAHLRFPVQYVLRPNLDFRGFSGTVASGVIKKGDRVMSLPSRRTSTVTRIVTFDGDREEAFPPQAVTVTLADEIDVSRGDMLVHEDDLPQVARSIEAMVVWMNERPCEVGASFLVKHGTKLVSAEVSEIHERVDVSTLERHPARTLGLNDVGRVTLTAARPLLFDPYAQNRATGAFIVIDRLTNGTFGAGMILGAGASEPQEIEASGTRGVSLAERMRRLGQRPAAIVLSGGDEARREELGTLLERRLWDDGYTAHLLGPRAIGAATVCQDLGLISILLADGTTELSGLRASLPAAQILMVDCGDADGGGSVEAVLRELRQRDVIR